MGTKFQNILLPSNFVRGPKGKTVIKDQNVTFFNVEISYLKAFTIRHNKTLPLLMKIDLTIFKINMTDHSQDITKKQLQRQLKAPFYKKTLLGNIYIKEKHFAFFLGETW